MKCSPLSRVDAALADIAAGRMVVVHGADAGGTASVVRAAQGVHADDVNFMTRRAGGWIFLALTPERCDQLGLPLMAPQSNAPHSAQFTVTFEARDGITTGISAADQAHTMQVAADPDRDRDEIVVPGHVRPLRAAPGGVLERPGLTEAAVDLTRLAGLAPAATLCEIQNEDGTMADTQDVVAYCAKHGLKAITIEEVAAYRRHHESIVRRDVVTTLDTDAGELVVHGYREIGDGDQHLALVKGRVGDHGDVPVAVHHGCLLGDVLRSRHCTCGKQLERALSTIHDADAGVVVYLAARDRADGLLDELDRLRRAPEQGADAVAHQRADARTAVIAAQILRDLSVATVRLTGDDPMVERELERVGIYASAARSGARRR